MFLYFHNITILFDKPPFIVQDVYKNITSTIAGVVHGLNATVFAYGSTGRYAFTRFFSLVA
jgi:hypothetical protein